MGFDPKRIHQKICEALAAQGYTESDRSNVASHFTEWMDVLFALCRFFQNPDRYKADEVEQLLEQFIEKVPPHLVEASRSLTKLEIPVFGKFRSELIHKLIAEEHLEPEERSLLEQGGVRAEELVESIMELLQTNRFFPTQATLWRPGEEVFDGVFIEKLKNGQGRVYYQKARDMDAFILEESKCGPYEELNLVVQKFIHFKWKNKIDGIKIVWPKTWSVKQTTVG
jgi:hypothetical protein